MLSNFPHLSFSTPLLRILRASCFNTSLAKTPDARTVTLSFINSSSTVSPSSLIDVKFFKVPGIKVDNGAKAPAGSSGETITEGLDGLRDRLKEYREMGARFAKWRAVIAVSDTLPSAACVKVNAHALARYAALCQEQDVVPIVEPEVLMDGTHTIACCEQATETSSTRFSKRCLFRKFLSKECCSSPTWLSREFAQPSRPPSKKLRAQRCAVSNAMCRPRFPASFSYPEARIMSLPRSI
jgi:fructose-bisphosphate aldolase class I